MTSAPEIQTDQRRRILIVDDDPSMVHVLARTLLDLAQLHFSVRGEDALVKLVTHVPDVMVIDADMPDLSGYEVIERMRRLPNGSRTQIIMVTSHDDEVYRGRARQAGVVDFFVKPINRTVVRDRVVQLLTSSSASVISANSPPVVEPMRPADLRDGLPTKKNQAESVSAKPLLRSDVITSELFDRMSAILEQTEAIRSRSRKDLSAIDQQSISRIEEQCAEVVQLLVTLSDSDNE